jgi:DNA polymerase III subunit alpha
MKVHRASAFASIERALERAKSATKEREAGQANLFGLLSAGSDSSGFGASSGDRYVDAVSWDSKELLSYEKKSLGFFLSGHPLDRYGRLPYTNTAQVAEMPERSKVRVLGIVEGYRERPIKSSQNGAKMAFFELEDTYGRLEAKVRPEQVDTLAPVLTSGEPVVIKGFLVYDRRNANEDEDESAVEANPQILIDSAVLLTEALKTEAKSVHLLLHQDRVKRERVSQLVDLFHQHRGQCSVSMKLVMNDGAEVNFAVGQQFRIEPNDQMLAGLERIFEEKVASIHLSS